ncbi:hypothetical protein ACIOWI_04520 [Streptomyces sp. NPDC087659]|uniref:hypothetical protein n=1 Tax=unclassified Streptomyces TaxID=2593676 RepID=UPI0036583A87
MRRRAWLTLGAVVLGGAGVVTVATANPSDPPRPAGPPERVAKLRTLARRVAAGRAGYSSSTATIVGT